MSMLHVIIALLCFSITYTCVAADDKTLRIYHDADYSVNQSSAHSMKMGLLTAFDETNNEIQGYRLELVEKDHRGNIRRSKQNMEHFINDPDALFILGGLHSPPYIKNRAFINENEILLLVPWAAGGPITRYPDGENWVFRLSVDDTVAGIRLGEFAVKKMHCKHPHLILENTPWGKSNHKTISSFLNEKVPFGVSWFSWNTKQNTARMMLRDTINSGADCILLVANLVEGKEFFQAMYSLPVKQRTPLISHWGITGGDVDDLMSKEVKNGISLHFIQSCFSFINNSDAFTQQVITRAKKRFPNAFQQPELLPSPAGFIHSYDLGKLVIEAIHQIKLTGNMKQDRKALRKALENIQNPVQGLIKTYHKPFQAWSEQHPDAHEALKLDNFCMAQFGKQNQIEVISN